MFLINVSLSLFTLLKSSLDMSSVLISVEMSNKNPVSSIGTGLDLDMHSVSSHLHHKLLSMYLSSLVE